MGVRIRPAGTADAVGLAKILVEVDWFADRIGTDVAEIAAHVESLLPDPEDPTRELVVADDVEGVVGYAHWTVTYPLCLSGPSVYLLELFVADGARGRGIGTTLLDHVDQRAQAVGAARTELLTGRQRDSYRRGFYADRGFEEMDGLAVFQRSIERG